MSLGLTELAQGGGRLKKAVQLEYGTRRLPCLAKEAAARFPVASAL